MAHILYVLCCGIPKRNVQREEKEKLGNVRNKLKEKISTRYGLLL